VAIDIDKELEEIQARAKQRIEAILRSHADEGNTTSDAERAVALAKAMDIARRAGLELYKIKSELKRDNRFIAKRVELGGHGKWRVQLALALRDALIVSVMRFTNTVATKPNKRTGNETRTPYADYISVVGMPSDVEIFEYLYTFISREIVKAADMAYSVARVAATVDFTRTFEDVDLGTRRGALRLRAWMPQGKAFRDAFYRGAVETLRARLAEMFADRKVTGDAGENETMALIPLKKADVAAAEKELFPDATYGKSTIWKLQKSKRRLTTAADDEAARMAGREAGKSLDLRKGIETGFTGALPAPAETND